ncbi:hypothetical protein KJN74_02890 [Candidatus Bathyarchaeota archaeon]|nr:hypothetical protein [Candidatus Bathyarchaeota archaeon]
MKNIDIYKKIVPITIIFLILNMSILLVHISTVNAQNQEAKLTGIITDQGVDTNNDGSFDSLLIGVEINVTNAGIYNVEVFGLYDSSSNYVEISNENSTYLNSGIQVVYVSLDGSSIYASGLNLNTIAIIDLYGESGNEIDVRYDLSLSQTYSFFDFQHVPSMFGFNNVQRNIILDQTGNIFVNNIYSLRNLGFWANSINIGFPEGAYDFEVRDEMGTLDSTTNDNNMNITLRNTIYENETETIHVNYHLKWDDQITQENGIDYFFSFAFYEEFNTLIKKLMVSVTLPKGATYHSSTNLNPDNVEKVNLQETLKFSLSDVAPSEDLEFIIKYNYNIFWGSFYPTLWVGILAIIGYAGFFFLGSQKIISTPTMQVPMNDINNFVEAYDEKTSIKSELESLDERLKKGKIPRRRYKVRKKMLDSRLSTISRNLSTIRRKLRASGSKYSRLMNQLEVAETKLEGTERDIQRIKLRYNRGEISKNAYRNLLSEYQSGTEDAENTIDGVLLRLRD